MTKFNEYTRKWIDYVKFDKNPTDEEWNIFFAQSNPVAGINRGVLTDIYKDKTGQYQVNERTTIKNYWSDIKKKFSELYSINDDNKRKTKLKEIKDYLLKLIEHKGGKRKPEAAINRILVTLCPDCLLSIPNLKHVQKLAELLNNISDIDKKDWIDLCFDIKPKLEQKYPNIMHWNAYCKLVMENNLTKNFNLILTGAPGTGKTYMAKQLAVNMTRANSSIGSPIKPDAEEAFTKLKEKGFVDFVQFHPSYDYTDFVEGLRPTLSTNSFVRTDGVFKAFCAKAANDKDHKYVFVIDEINRGEISKIFGELFFSIDPGYRGKEKGLIETQYQNLIEVITQDEKEKMVKQGITPYPFDKGFFVPTNVYIIGTMNDIDRSVESMDFAFRRRFTFYEITAEDSKSMLWDGVNSQVLEDVMDRINNELIKPEYGLSEAYQIGASYFNKIKKTTGKKDYDYKNELDDLWEYQIKGLLFEYLRGKPNASVLLKQLETAYKGKGKPDTENDEA